MYYAVVPIKNKFQIRKSTQLKQKKSDGVA